MNPCKHPRVDTPTGRLALLLSPKGRRCAQCDRCLRINFRTRLRALALVLLLPGLLGILFHSAIAGIYGGLVALFIFVLRPGRLGLDAALLPDAQQRPIP